MPMVKMPHGLLARALTTTIPRPASVTSRMKSTAIMRHQAGEGADLGAGDLGQRAALVAHGGHQHGEVLHAPGQHRAESSQRKPGAKPNCAASVGPTSGPAPAMAAKWCPKSTQRGEGT